MAYTKLQAPKHLGRFIVDYTEENVEKYYPLRIYTRQVLPCKSIDYSSLCCGFYSIEKWEEYLIQIRTYNAELEKQLIDEITWRYKIKMVIRRFKRIFSISWSK
jgi:hypothetical protein